MTLNSRERERLFEAKHSVAESRGIWTGRLLTKQATHGSLGRDASCLYKSPLQFSEDRTNPSVWIYREKTEP